MPAIKPSTGASRGRRLQDWTVDVLVSAGRLKTMATVKACKTATLVEILPVTMPSLTTTINEHGRSVSHSGRWLIEPLRCSFGQRARPRTAQKHHLTE